MPTCQHIQAALRCYAEAQPLTLRNSILSSLNVNNETKQEIWLLATETAGPLVQRVSKNIMAVKCKASPKHPLGYLHFSFFVAKLKDRTEHRYLCSCTAFKVNSFLIESFSPTKCTIRFDLKKKKIMYRRSQRFRIYLIYCTNSFISIQIFESCNFLVL